MFIIGIASEYQTQNKAETIFQVTVFSADNLVRQENENRRSFAKLRIRALMPEATVNCCGA